MTTYNIELEYYAGISSTFELPEGRKWDDVTNHYVKWDTLYITYKDGTNEDIDLEFDYEDAIDTKRPKTVTIYPD